MNVPEKQSPKERALRRQNERLLRRLSEAEDALRSLRKGEVDAIVVSRKRKEQLYALSGPESIYRMIVETMNEAALTVSFEERILFCNGCFSEIVGQTPDRIVGRLLSEYVPSNAANDVRMLLAQVREGAVRRPLVLLNSKGKKVPMHVSACVLNHPEETCVCLVAADLSLLEESRERTRKLQIKQQTILHQREQLESILKSIPAGVIIAEAPSGRILMTNPGVSEIGRHPIEDAESLEEYPMFAGFYPDGRPYRPEDWPIVRSIRKGEQVFQEEIKIRRKDGSYGWVAVNSLPLRNDEGKITMGISAFIDISELKEVHEKLRRINSELEMRVEERTLEVRRQADQLRALANQLNRTEQQERLRIAKVLHDNLQQLIVAAQLQLESIRQRLDSKAETLQANVRSVNATLDDAIHEARSLAVDLFPPVLHEIGLIAALEWYADRMSAKEKFTIHVDADDDAEPFNKETRYLLFECVRELVLNVVKHAGVLVVHLDVRRTEDNAIRLVTRDGGKGFDPEILKIRNPEDSTFGLFSIQERLRCTGGRMDIEAAPGRGCRIILTVPDEMPVILPSDSLERARPKSVPRNGARAPAGGLLRILVVDDHPLVREGLIAIFKNIPEIEVVGEATGAVQALGLAERLQPDVVLMDYSLGAMTGAEATRRILASFPRIKVISVSARSDDSVVKQMKEAGAVFHFDKSENPRILVEEIRSFQTGS